MAGHGSKRCKERATRASDAWLRPFGWLDGLDLSMPTSAADVDKTVRSLVAGSCRHLGESMSK